MKAAECPREIGHLQPGAGRALLQHGEKVNYTLQAVGPGGREAAGHDAAAGGAASRRCTGRGSGEVDGSLESGMT